MTDCVHYYNSIHVSEASVNKGHVTKTAGPRERATLSTSCAATPLYRAFSVTRAPCSGPQSRTASRVYNMYSETHLSAATGLGIGTLRGAPRAVRLVDVPLVLHHGHHESHLAGDYPSWWSLIRASGCLHGYKYARGHRLANIDISNLLPLSGKLAAQPNTDSDARRCSVFVIRRLATGVVGALLAVAVAGRSRE